MNKTPFSQFFWGDKAKFSHLLLAALIMLFAFLGGRELWTQEHRWADIVAGMFLRQDFLHPYLGEHRYYDKPLLSYWLIIGVSKVIGSFNIWALRLPSALAGLLSIYSIYRLGSLLKNRSLGLLAGWLLLTTFYFVFWARISSADMLNLAGSLFALTWYYQKRHHATLFDYAIFFCIVALTSLCKGLIGAVIPFIAVSTDILLQKSWRAHLKPMVLLSLLPAILLYLAPFIASSFIDGKTYGENGLYQVYRENFLRFFQPFDHQGPIYTYLIYLPVYLFPWTLLFFPAVVSLVKRWSQISPSSKWLGLVLLFIFIFFSASGSRRSYYVLPMLPFAILLTADWMLSSSLFTLRQKTVSYLISIAFIISFLTVCLLPTWYYSQFGINRFAETLKSQAEKTQPLMQWNVVMLDGETKLNFYLHLSPLTKNYGIPLDRETQTTAMLEKAWPILKNKPDKTIFITRKMYATLLKPYFVGYQLVEANYPTDSFFKKIDLNVPIAFIPLL